MPADAAILDALATRRLCDASIRAHYPDLPEHELVRGATIHVDSATAQYVAAMADGWPRDQDLSWPSMEQVRWPFPDRLAVFVWSPPIALDFRIISIESTPCEPFEEPREILATYVFPPRHNNGSYVVDVHPERDITSAGWPWTTQTRLAPGQRALSQWPRFGRALVEAVGARYTTLADPPGRSRATRRAIRRTPSPVRVLYLNTPTRATNNPDARSIPWSKRWIVRGHWRNQACGPGRQQNRQVWIDPFVKGPPDKPLDTRPEVLRFRNTDGDLDPPPRP